MSNEEILPPENLSNTPDKATQKGLQDYTSPSADLRVLHINLGFFKFGTDDKVLATAFTLAILLIIIITVISIAGIFSEKTEWIEKMFSWSTNAFLVVLGVALGKGTNGTKGNDNEN
jgi:hypothetical protein